MQMLADKYKHYSKRIEMLLLSNQQMMAQAENDKELAGYIKENEQIIAKFSTIILEIKQKMAELKCQV